MGRWHSGVQHIRRDLRSTPGAGTRAELTGATLQDRAVHPGFVASPHASEGPRRLLLRRAGGQEVFFSREGHCNIFIWKVLTTTIVRVAFASPGILHFVAQGNNCPSCDVT